MVAQGARADCTDKMRQRLQEKMNTVLEEIIFSQANKFDSHALRLLFEFQWKVMNCQTSEIMRELADVKERCEAQSFKLAEMQDLKDKVAR